MEEKDFPKDLPWDHMVTVKYFESHYSITLEELYQVFKKRFLLESDENPQVLRGL